MKEVKPTKEDIAKAEYLCKIKHYKSGDVFHQVLVKANEDDCEWRTSDDGSEFNEMAFDVIEAKLIGEEIAAKEALEVAREMKPCPTEDEFLSWAKQYYHVNTFGFFAAKQTYDYLTKHQSPQWREEKEKLLQRAHKIIKEGKTKFTPNTTNGFVDEWLNDAERIGL